MAQLKKAIQTIDPKPDKKTEHTLLLAMLQELCEAHGKRLARDVRESLADSRTVVADVIIQEHQEQRAYVHDDAGKIATEVATAIKHFTGGGGIPAMIDGMASLVSKGLQGIVGSGEGKGQETGSYYVMIENGAFVRYDFRAWSRDITVTGIGSTIESAIAIVACKSTVDVPKVKWNTFLAAFNRQLANMELPPEKQAENKKLAKELFQELGGKAIPTDDVASLDDSDFIAPGELTFLTL